VVDSQEGDAQDMGTGKKPGWVHWKQKKFSKKVKSSGALLGTSEKRKLPTPHRETRNGSTGTNQH